MGKSLRSSEKSEIRKRVDKEFRKSTRGFSAPRNERGQLGKGDAREGKAGKVTKKREQTSVNSCHTRFPKDQSVQRGVRGWRKEGGRKQQALR